MLPDDDAEAPVGDVLAVGGDAAVAGDLGLPLLAGLDDLLVGAAHEVPPHHDLLAERRPSEHHEAAGLEGLEPQRRTSRLDVRQLGRLDLLVTDHERAGVEEHAVLEGLVDLEVEHRAGLEEQLDPEQRRGGPDRRGVAQRRAQEDPGLPAGRGERGRYVVLEVGGVVAGSVGERDPQLDAVQRGGAGGRDLRVAHAPAAGHQVELAGADQRLVAGRVTVLDLTGEQPAHRLQAGVRVGRHDHAAGVVDLVGPVVVGEAPRAHERTTTLRQGTAHGHRPQPAERDLARGEYLGHAGTSCAWS